jgi:hypothetical protein
VYYRVKCRGSFCQLETQNVGGILQVGGKSGIDAEPIYNDPHWDPNRLDGARSEDPDRKWFPQDSVGIRLTVLLLSCIGWPECQFSNTNEICRRTKQT